VVVQAVAACRVAAVVRAGAAAVAVPAGGVEAAEKERRHSRGHRHGRAPSPRQQLIRERTVCNKLALASLQVKHRLSQEEEVNQGGRPPEIFRPRRARVCLSYAAAARKKKCLACLLTEVGPSSVSATAFILALPQPQPLANRVLGYGLLGREWYLGAHAFAPRINA
jgi:hypothetical protein